MFCKYCGNETGDGATFCPKCGKAVEENTRKDAYHFSENDSSQPATRSQKNNSSSVENTNHRCIAGLVLAVLSIIVFILNWNRPYHGYDVMCLIVSIAGFVVSISGYRQAHKNNQEGTLFAVIGMAVCPVAALITFAL